MRKFFVGLLALPLLFTACLDTLELALPRSTSRRQALDEKTVIAGLKEALKIGTQNAVEPMGILKTPASPYPCPRNWRTWRRCCANWDCAGRWMSLSKP